MRAEDAAGGTGDTDRGTASDLWDKLPADGSMIGGGETDLGRDAVAVSSGDTQSIIGRGESRGLSAASLLKKVTAASMRGNAIADRCGVWLLEFAATTAAATATAIDPIEPPCVAPGRAATQLPCGVPWSAWGRRIGEDLQRGGRGDSRGANGGV